MSILTKILGSNPPVKEIINQMISEQRQELLRYKTGSPLANRINEKISLLEELAERLKINLND